MDVDGYLRFILALVFVLALLGLVAVAARRLGLGYRTPAQKGRTRRLSLVEIMPLDARRRLVLVQRDDVEHLVLIGGPGGDLLVEAGIRLPHLPDFAQTLKSEAARTAKETP